jgi:hypothetical protein
MYNISLFIGKNVMQLEFYRNTFGGESVKFTHLKTEEEQLNTWTCPFFNKAKQNASQDTYEDYKCKGEGCSVEVMLDAYYGEYRVLSFCSKAENTKK